MIRILFVFLAYLFTLPTFANPAVIENDAIVREESDIWDWKPSFVIGARVGENWINEDFHNQSVELVEGYIPDTYLPDNNSATKVGGTFFVGAEWSAEDSDWRFQTLIEYDYLPQFNLTGDIYQFGLSSHDALSYKYTIKNQRLGGELKILRKMGDWYPYINGVLGIAWNKSKNYVETSDLFAELAREPFNDTTTRSLTWSAGAGIERSFCENFRVGIGYLYTDAGKANLDAINSGDSLHVKHININQALFQLSYVH